jgi:protein TonB
MSKDPKTNPPPNGKPQESLEDLVYRSNLAGGSKELRGANPLVAVPVTILMYGVCGFLAVTVAKHTDAGKKVIKTMGINLQEESEAPPPPPPPPPPAPAAPAAPAPKIAQKEAPPPPPIDPRQDTVPEVAPKALPKEDLSMKYASSSAGSGSGVPGGGVAGGGPVGGMAVAGAGQGRIMDFDFSQMKVKYQPPPPQYPPLAKIAKIQGTVVVELTVGTDGIPMTAHAIEGPPQLRAVCEAFAMGWKFEPAMMNGVPQQARFTIKMPFKLK